MNFELPYGFTVTLGLNGMNFILGIVTVDDFNMMSAIIGLTMNFIYFLVKMYQALAKQTAVFDHDTLKRTCPNCKNVFETDSATQVFCTPECRTAFNEDAHSRRP